MISLANARELTPPADGCSLLLRKASSVPCLAPALPGDASPSSSSLITLQGEQVGRQRLKGGECVC